MKLDFDELIWLCLVISLCVVFFAASNAFASTGDVELGRRIYMEGVLPSGALLKGVRDDQEFSGKDAACAACHRPSGMGSVEGDIQVPPITGNFLFRTGDSLQVTMDPRSGKRFNQAHDAYTDATLAKAIRTGVNVGDQSMSALMPRYALKDDELRALTAYLKQLSQTYSPGVSREEVHFATVVTPDADPEKRRILLKVLERGFVQKNGSTMLGSKRSGRRHMVTAAELVLGTERKWVQHIWQLQGAPETWPQQLQKFNQEQPVFALLSGLSGGTWQPVHDFCEREHMPCWLPSVDLPVDVGNNRYSLYFQRGVLLEADVLARYFDEEPKQAPKRIVQIYRENAAGLGAAAELASAFKTSGIALENRPLLKNDLASFRKSLADLTERDAVMLWLNPTDLGLLNAVSSPKAAVYISGRMAGEQVPVADSWKQAVKMIYPYELPDRRQINLNYFHRWMRVNQIAIEDEPLQAEAYFALDFLSETMTEMLDNLYRDYLLERAESMLSRSETGKSEQRDRVRQVMRWSTRVPRVSKETQESNNAAELAKKPVSEADQAVVQGKSTTIYPRMSLGVGQRFTSKGAYIVRFDAANKNKLIALSPWLIP